MKNCEERFFLSGSPPASPLYSTVGAVYKILIYIAKMISDPRPKK
jgi:hypothetical protein